MSKSADGVYTRPDRGGYWISWNDARGRRRYRKTDAQTLTQARAARAAELVRVEQAKVLGFTPPGKETLSELAPRYLAHQKARISKTGYLREEGIVKAHLMPSFSGPIASIRRGDIQRYITKRIGEASPYSVQKELNCFKHMLRLAMEWEIIPVNPAQGIKPPRVPAGRVRYLQPGELKAVTEACPEWLRPIVVLAACTGMRRSEILGLRWLDIDFSNNRVLLPQTKNGDGRIVYLNKMAVAALQSVLPQDKPHPTHRPFSAYTPAHVSVTFSRVCARLEIHDFRFHDLRHTAASWLRMQGADIHTVALLLGHKDLRMAARYQHLSPTFLSEAVGRLESVFGQLQSPPESPVEDDDEASTPRALSAS
jgi:integrase